MQRRHFVVSPIAVAALAVTSPAFARATPHMYIVNPQGMLVYAGGIDSIASANPADIKTATNYIKQSLGETFSGKPISSAMTKPYGCSIKYKS